MRPIPGRIPVLFLCGKGLERKPHLSAMAAPPFTVAFVGALYERPFWI